MVKVVEESVISEYFNHNPDLLIILDDNYQSTADYTRLGNIGPAQIYAINSLMKYLNKSVYTDKEMIIWINNIQYSISIDDLGIIRLTYSPMIPTTIIINKAYVTKIAVYASAIGIVGSLLYFLKNKI